MLALIAGRHSRYDALLMHYLDGTCHLIHIIQKQNILLLILIRDDKRECVTISINVAFDNLQCIQHLANRLVNLHNEGYVHRDLKPGNVMWLPRENRWTVIDFGCAAKTGKEAGLGFSIMYAAPEVIASYRSGKRKMKVTEALDVWSLGVLAIELLTGEMPLNLQEGAQAVCFRSPYDFRSKPAR